MINITFAKSGLLAGCLMLAGVTQVLAQSDAPAKNGTTERDGTAPAVAQVVALDECDPTTFNAALGPDFCKNVALAGLGFATTLDDLFAKAAAGTPDRGWDFEPDRLTINEGTSLSVADMGGEPHTFTEVKHFGGGFIPGLNAGVGMAPECVGGFSKVSVAKTRILQGSHVEVSGLSKGQHKFECCIHPWMHVTVDVQ